MSATTDVIPTFFLYIFFYFFFFLLAASQQQQTLNNDDTRWLLSFKDSSIFEDPSGLLSSWNLSTHPCEPTNNNNNSAGGGGGGWFGVSCDAQMVVVSLNLSGISAIGTLSPSLANLTHLRVLSLAHNSFSGPIPPQLGYLSSLQVLELQGCNLSGAIPPSFASFVSIRLLNLSHNSLSGSIPAGLIASPPNLTVLDISNNLLSGNILTGSCQSLTYLSLSNNFLADQIPAQLGGCSNLTTLLLDGNILQGNLPTEIGRLSLLQILDVSRNSLTGAVPVELTGCRSLSLLVLTNLNDFQDQPQQVLDNFASFRGEFNAFDGDLPWEVLLHPNLQMLWAPRANLGSGSLPNNWTNPCSLRVLNLAQNNITGSIPQSLMTMCTNLTYLDLSSNAFQGSLPPNLQAMIHCMVYFNVSRNSLSGGITVENAGTCGNRHDTKSSSSSSLSSCCCGQDLLGLLDLLPNSYYSFANSQCLDISSGTIGSSIMAHDFSWNRFTGPLPLFSPLINNTTSAYYWLLLNNNNFTGSLSDEQLVSSFCSFTFQLHNLYLNLNANGIHGGIASNLFNCSTSLVHFEAAQNMINGSIPSLVGALKMLRYLDLSKNVLSGPLPDTLAELTSLQYIILSGNYLTGQIPAQLGQLSSLLSLNFSHNHLTESIPATLGHASSLEILLLDHNNLSGDIPSSLAALPKLTQLDLSFNNLSGDIPNFRPGINCDGFAGNQFLGLCPDDDSLAPAATRSPDYPTQERHKKLKPLLIALPTAASILVSIVILVPVLLLLGRQNLTRLAGLRRKIVVAFADAPTGLTYDNVVRATGNFSVGNLIGTGGFGSTYKAELVPGFLVAVKRLSIGRFQGIKQFHAEIKTLGTIRHKNLVTLIGYYVGDAEMFLVYNYLPGGDLETFIHESSGANKDLRVMHKIAVDIAQALTYLHYSCVPRIVHRDIKPSNILLDEQLNAYLSDFGLARLLEVFETHATTDVAGTFGYVAPEYATTCRVSYKADVYSFGVVLLELMSGKKSLDPSFSEYGNGFNIVAWAGMLVSEGRSSELFSPELWESGPQDELLAMLSLASSCTMESLSMRPSMKQVLEILKQLTCEAEIPAFLCLQRQ